MIFEIINIVQNIIPKKTDCCGKDLGVKTVTLTIEVAAALLKKGLVGSKNLLSRFGSLFISLIHPKTTFGYSIFL
jgi:hypothetical protein